MILYKRFYFYLKTQLKTLIFLWLSYWGKRKVVGSLQAAAKTFQENNFIVSLTTTSYRIHLVHHTIYSLLNQSLLPEKIVLWVSRDAFGRDQGVDPSQIPDELKKLQNETSVFELRYYENIGPYRKLIPSLESFPDKDIITADDDFLYPRDWCLELINGSIENPECVVCHRARTIKCIANDIAKYREWPLLKNVSKGLNLIPIQGDGALYPFKLRRFYGQLMDKKAALKACPFADDIWFRHCLLINSVQVLKVGNYKMRAFDFGFLSSYQLWSENLSGESKNDEYIKGFKFDWLQKFKETNLLG